MLAAPGECKAMSECKRDNWEIAEVGLVIGEIFNNRETLYGCCAMEEFGSVRIIDVDIALAFKGRFGAF